MAAVHPPDRRTPPDPGQRPGPAHRDDPAHRDSPARRTDRGGHAAGNSLRDYLAVLRERGDYVTVSAPVDPRYDLGAILSLTEAGPAVCFENVVGAEMHVVGNVLTGRRRIALGLGVEADDLAERTAEAIGRPIPVAMHRSGPCHEVEEPRGLASLPVPTFFESETGPYITAGVVLARDVDTGRANMSFARLKVIDSNHAMLGVSPRHHLGRMIRRAHENGADLPFAVAIGTHPAVLLAACLYLDFGTDELECAGALLGRPIDAVRAGHADIAVPADAEIVVEAIARAAARVPEGLVSEYHGHYHDYGDGFLVDVIRVTRREDAALHVIVPGLHGEHLLLGAVAIAAGLQRHLQQLSGNVVRVAVPLTGAGRVSAVISVTDLSPGEASRMMMACFAAVPLIRQVVLVDAPLDPWNGDAVEWARTFHARPDRDIHVFPPSQSDRSDPLARDGAVTKIGIDATTGGKARDVGWSLARPPADAMDRAVRALAGAGIATARSELVGGVLGA